jgi:pilus assembly protein FimV
LLRLAKILVVIFLLAPISASPLGLGDIRLHSALNQQFDAEIDMLSLGQTRLEDINVRLASREAFERAGIERPLFLSRLVFDVEPGPGNTAVIRIRSDQPVREPFLNFLVEVNWPNGRLLREYTVLLDPPLFLDESPSAIQAPTVSVVESPPPRVAAPQREATPAAAAPRAVPSRISGSFEIAPDGAWSYGPVQKSDTLWSIASEFRAGDDSVSTEQIMMALLRNNPEAFYNHNINELRAGHVLRIDDPSTIGLMGRAEAAAEARRQFAHWQDAKRERAGAAEPRPLGGDEGVTAMSPGAGVVGDTGPRLRLSAPDIADADRFAMSDVDLGEAGRPDAATVSRLREDLVSALEISESARQENLELRQRLAELEEQISSMQRLLSLQDDTMAALQAGVGIGIEAQPEPEVAEMPQPEPVPEAAETPQPAPPVAVAPPVAPADSSLFDAIPGVSGLIEAIPDVAGLIEAIPDVSGLIETILDDPIMLGAVAFLLLMLATLGWLIVRRRQMAGATLDELAPAPQRETSRVTAAAGAASATAAPIADALEDSIIEAEGRTDEIGLDIMQAEEDEIDILAEADVYLAYRRFDKAEELLRHAIRNEPGRQDLVLKLLEVHAGSGNTEAFVAEAESLQASLDPGDEAMWDQVVAMGRRVAPGYALFAGEGAAPVQAEAGMDLQGDGLDLAHEGFAGDEDLTGMSVETLAPEGLADLDMTLDDETLARLETGTEEFTTGAEDAQQPAGVGIGSEEPAAGEPYLADASAPATSIDTTSPAAGSGEELVDDELEKQLLAAGSGEGIDVDWLSEIGSDLEFANMGGDEAGGDFSGLISGEDEVGTKLDLARAYIDMGDQDSARSILSEVTEEGNEDQQREADDLMRRIG